MEEFVAHALSDEMDLNVIANHFGINRKLRWEEVLTLKDTNLKGILKDPEGKRVALTSFGSAVFINCQPHEIRDMVLYLQRIDSHLKEARLDLMDTYHLAVEPGAETMVHYDQAVVPSVSPHHHEIISVVLAKSVALERIELGINRLLDESEEIVRYLETGKLNISDQRLAKLTARILSFKYNSLSYIMLLDKPDVAWRGHDTLELFTELSGLFELGERYGRLQLKTETLQDITDSFANFTHARRSNRLEWVVIILIGLEIAMSLFERWFR
ncbi:MAG: RMD1 family protein [Bacillota bacterium]